MKGLELQGIKKNRICERKGSDIDETPTSRELRERLKKGVLKAQEGEHLLRIQKSKNSRGKGDEEKGERGRYSEYFFGGN